MQHRGSSFGILVLMFLANNGVYAHNPLGVKPCQSPELVQANYIDGESTKIVTLEKCDNKFYLQGAAVKLNADNAVTLNYASASASSARTKNAIAVRRYNVVNYARWPNSIVPYRIDSSFSASEKSKIIGTINNLSSLTYVNFIPASNEKEFVNILRGSDGGCWSYVGWYPEDVTTVSLSNGCFSGGVITHELMHAIGFWHEQSRSDRDIYVSVDFNNIISRQEHNFAKQISDGVDIGGYDYNSVMHYSAYAFSKDITRPTIIARDNPNRILGGDVLSDGDINAVNAIYNTSVTNNSLPTGAEKIGFANLISILLLDK